MPKPPPPLPAAPEKPLPLGPPRLLVALGNPGAEYAATRHNVGFMLADQLLKARGGCFRKKYDGEFAEIELGGRPLFLLKPMTYMNASGDAVRKCVRDLDIKAEEILAVYDEAGLPPGKIRLRYGGSSAGHNGIKSLLERLGGADFVRLRIGIGHPGKPEDLADHVLTPFGESERPLIEESLSRAAEAVLMLCSQGCSAAMNQFNGTTPKKPGSRQPNQESR
ncbi:MAG: hypothetical protein RL095_2369 [Verrucomicrobiota bacterium]|jgi:PTH1 family peptidyl-tRNA hydrolase